MAMTPKLTEFDRRVQAGSKVVMVGEAACAMTPDEVVAARLVARVFCACGHQGWMGCHQLRDRGLGGRSLGDLAPRLRRENGCRGRAEIKLVDPCRSALIRIRKRRL